MKTNQEEIAKWPLEKRENQKSLLSLRAGKRSYFTVIHFIFTIVFKKLKKEHIFL
jgi:hypothetical protein